MFSLIRAWINGWVNNREAGDLRRYRAHYDVIVMSVNTTGPEQNTHHFADGVSKLIVVNENVSISNNISLKYFPWGVIYNKSILTRWFGVE